MQYSSAGKSATSASSWTAVPFTPVVGSATVFLVLPYLGLLLDLRDLVRLRLLRLVRVIGPCVDLELAQRLAAERVLGQHPPDGLLHRPLRVAGHQARVRHRPEAARVTRVPVGVLLLQLAAGQRDLGRVDHDDEVAGVDVRREDRLVLAPQQHGHVAGQAAEHDVRSVDDVPPTRNVTVLRAECAHSPEPSRMYRGQVGLHLRAAVGWPLAGAEQARNAALNARTGHAPRAGRQRSLLPLAQRRPSPARRPDQPATLMPGTISAEGPAGGKR